MDQLVEVFEDVLACYLVYFGCEDPNFSVILGILPSILVFRKNSLEENILLLDKVKIFLQIFHFLDSGLIKVPFHSWFKAYQSSFIVFELEHSPEYRFFSIFYFAS